MRKKLTILQVLPALQVGGLERGAIEMANYISAQGATSLIASNGGRMESTLNPSVEHITLPLHRRTPWHVWHCARAIAELIKENDVDIVHARSRIPAWAARLACNWTKTPMVATFHGTHKCQNGFKRWYNSGAAKADRVIAISQFIKDYIIENFKTPEDVIDIAPRGIEPKIFTPTRFTSENLENLKKQYNIPENTPILNLTGRITRWKGHTEMVQLLAKIKDLHWVCLFIGSAGKKEAYKEELQELIEKEGLSSRILFIGDQGDPAPFYLMSDLAFSMSIQPEAFGRVAIEAGAMGTAMFATAHGGSLETVIDGETGLLAPVGDLETMAKMLRNALQNTENLHKMGDKARQHVHNTFTTEKTCAAEWHTYETLLSDVKNKNIADNAIKDKDTAD